MDYTQNQDSLGQLGSLFSQGGQALQGASSIAGLFGGSLGGLGAIGGALGGVGLGLGVLDTIFSGGQLGVGDLAQQYAWNAPKFATNYQNTGFMPTSTQDPSYNPNKSFIDSFGPSIMASIASGEQITPQMVQNLRSSANELYSLGRTPQAWYSEPSLQDTWRPGSGVQMPAWTAFNNINSGANRQFFNTLNPQIQGNIQSGLNYQLGQAPSSFYNPSSSMGTGGIFSRG